LYKTKISFEDKRRGPKIVGCGLYEDRTIPAMVAFLSFIYGMPTITRSKWLGKALKRQPSSLLGGTLHFNAV